MIAKKAIGIVCILLLSLEFSSNIADVVDLATYDEINYFWSGLTLGQQPIKADWGPLYSLQYYILSFFAEDKLDLYYLNQRLVICLIPIGLFLLLSSRIKHRYAFVVSIVLIYMSSSTMAFTKVNLLSTFLLLICGWIVIKPNLTFSLKIAGLAFILLLQSYIRPEYYLLFVSSITAVLLYAFVKLLFTRQVGNVLLPVAIAAVWTLAVYFIGHPIEGGRSIFAFKQMYAQNYVEWQGTPDIIPDHETIANKVFGPINSIEEALKSNPGEVWHHMEYNMSKLPELTVWKFVDITVPRRIIDTSPQARYNYFIERLFILLGLAACIFILLVPRQAKRPPTSWLWYALAFIIIGQGVAKAIFFFPDARYLTSVCLFMYASILVFTTTRFEFRYPFLKVAVPLAILVVIIINRPHVKDYFHADLINQKIFKAYEQIDFQYGDLIAVPHEFLGLSYQPATPVLLDANAQQHTQLKDPNVKAVVTTEQQIRTLAPPYAQYKSIPINDTLSVYYLETIVPNTLMLPYCQE